MTPATTPGLTPGQWAGKLQSILLDAIRAIFGEELPLELGIPRRFEESLVASAGTLRGVVVFLRPLAPHAVLITAAPGESDETHFELGRRFIEGLPGLGAKVPLRIADVRLGDIRFATAVRFPIGTPPDRRFDLTILFGIG